MVDVVAVLFGLYPGPASIVKFHTEVLVDHKCPNDGLAVEVYFLTDL